MREQAGGRHLLERKSSKKMRSIANDGHRVIYLSIRPDSLEELTLTYQKIIWTWTVGGISAEDEGVEAFAEEAGVLAVGHVAAGRAHGLGQDHVAGKLVALPAGRKPVSQ